MKIKLLQSGSDARLYCVPHIGGGYAKGMAGDYYSAADYEALEAKLAALVEIGEEIYADACVNRFKPIHLYDKLKAAIAAAKGR